MRRIVGIVLLALATLLTTAVSPAPPPEPNAISTPYVLVAWNDLGMHCTDGSDFSVSTILPPYNNIHAQLKSRTGALVTNPAGITVTYQAVADPAASINTTSVGKTNFWNYVGVLFGATPAPDVGLAGKAMPGSLNVPQAMDWDPVNVWFHAEGVPIVPYDDAGRKNYYPMMRVVAKNTTGTVLAQTDIVLPVSDEMDCRTCHQSGSNALAMPPGGWVYNASQAKDVKFNVLKLHDARQLSNPTFTAALATAGFSPQGLLATAQGGKPLLCQRCHATNALPGSGIAGISPMTKNMHAFHANVVDPTNGQILGASTNRTACYRCHPGSATKCLRGAMGDAVAADGSMEMQCQGCHGGMAAVGTAGRQGWLQEPSCQNCHTGTATLNAGFIRYTSALTATGALRQPADPLFATEADTPSPGLSLYRFSSGHGGLQCEACHGSTHAEYPSSHVNDNVQNVAIQGFAGMLSECTACHTTNPATVFGGPHGMHPVGASWVNGHKGAASDLGIETCQPCHGVDYTGTELSRALGPRTLSAFGTKTWWRGYQIGCYSCHNGASNFSQTPNRAPVVTNASATSTGGASVAIPLTATDADGNALTLRVVSQPVHGRAGLSNRTATFYPDPGYVGTDSFTVTAWDGQLNSSLATVSLTVNGPGCALAATATVPATGSVGTAVPFSATATPTNCAYSPNYDWNFGDGGAHAFAATPTHTYAAAGTYAWSLTISADAVSTVRQGTITVGGGASAPKVVPASVAPLRFATADHGTTLGVTWDATNCSSTGYHVIWGGGSGLSAWTVAGGQCNLGVTGSSTLTGTPNPTTDPMRFYWFLVVGDDGSATEGSWGKTSAGTERGGTAASTVCGFSTKSTGGACATP